MQNRKCYKNDTLTVLVFMYMAQRGKHCVGL